MLLPNLTFKTHKWSICFYREVTIYLNGLFLLHCFLREKMIWLQIDQSHVQFTTSSAAYIVFLWDLPTWLLHDTSCLKNKNEKVIWKLVSVIWGTKEYLYPCIKSEESDYHNQILSIIELSFRRRNMLIQLLKYF